MAAQCLFSNRLLAKELNEAHTPTVIPGFNHQQEGTAYRKSDEDKSK